MSSSERKARHHKRRRTQLQQKLDQAWQEQRWRQRLGLAVADTFWDYTRHTKVSGIWLLQAQRTHGATRWLWATVLVALFLLGVYLSLKLWMKFYSYPILNTIAADVAITDVAFPGVTICSPKVVNTERVARFVQTLNIPPPYTAAEVAAGFEYINSYTDHNWQPSSNVSYTAADAVLRHNNVSILMAARAISASCADFTRRCFWGTVEFPCRQQHEYLSFVESTSYLGPCCSFNYNPQNASYVPFAANIFGMDGGLSFIGVEGTERNLSTGLIVLVHHPKDDFVTEATATVTVTPNSESFVEISPMVQSSSPEVLELSERKRDCLTSNDLDLSSYRQATCILNCQTEAIYKRCRCQPYFLLNSIRGDSSSSRECSLSDTQCYLRNYDGIKSVKCEHCLPNCYDVTYSTLAYKTDLLLHNYSVSRLYTQTNHTNDTFIVRVYMAKQAVPSIRKVTVMSWIGLLSDLGGVFNLCLGLSIISLVEFFYYCTYRLHKNYYARGNF